MNNQELFDDFDYVQGGHFTHLDLNKMLSRNRKLQKKLLKNRATGAKDVKDVKEK